MTRVTIGFTTFNAAETIRRAVDSALRQDLINESEILVVDDVSSDDTLKVLETIKAAHPDRVRLLANTRNLGVAGARNQLIAQAKGEFLAFFDDDDDSAPDRLSRQMRRIVDYERDFARGAPVVCHTARRQTWPDGHQRTEPTLGTREGECAPHGEAVAAHILYNAALPHDDYGSMATCSQMARTALYRQIGGFDPDFRRSGDTELNIRLARAGAHFVGLADPLVHQTITRGTDKRLREERRCALMFYDKHEDFLKAHGRGSFDRRWLAAKYDYLEGARLRFLSSLARLWLSHPLLTTRRVLRAWPHFGYNRILRSFHTSDSHTSDRRR